MLMRVSHRAGLLREAHDRPVARKTVESIGSALAASGVRTTRREQPLFFSLQRSSRAAGRHGDGEHRGTAGGPAQVGARERRFESGERSWQ